jgi:hypothetical protein
MRRVGAILAIVWATIAAACFDFDATMRGGPLVDGGAEGGSDAGTDVAGDAGAETAAEASTGPFCATYPTSPGAIFFCDDFDESPHPSGWNSIHATSGSLAETDAASVSPPNSLDEVIPALTAGQALDVALRKVPLMPTLPSTLTFAFSVEPVNVDQSSGAAIVLGAIDFLDGAGGRYSVELAIQGVQSGYAAMALGEQSGFADGGASYVNHPLPLDVSSTLSVGSFTNLVITIDWTSPTGAEAKVEVNGTQKLDVPSLTMTVQPVSLQIGIGTSYVSEPSPGWELRYDNVVFTAK